MVPNTLLLIERPMNKPETGAVKKAVRMVLTVWVVLPLLFLATGGSLAWSEAWVYCAIILVPMTLFATWMGQRDPAFFERRLKVQERERTQRGIQIAGVPVFLAWFVVPGLDYRFGWSEVPLTATVIALVLSLAGYLMVLRVFVENRWAGRTVETWNDQKVVDTGPYAIVRHPMYFGTIVLFHATPIALGSWWGVLAALAITPLLVLRIKNEEKVLVDELPGYENYRKKVRYRLVPFIW
jgi:protein-S-isoprenylcysteine O-methyltransferase Ste14